MSRARNEEGGTIFNVQRFSLHDGPGIRTTVFMKGCPLDCGWCSNPESKRRLPEIMDYAVRCIKCGKCIETCPRGAITMGDGERIIDWEKCDLCLKCADACPAKAIERTGKVISSRELLRIVERDRLFYENSGGGVTFSGGEPLLQWEFVLDMLRMCKGRGIHTALDTSGYAEWHVVEKVLDHVDLVLYDLKHLDRKRHKMGTGVDNELILRNLNRMQGHARIWLRIPVIPGYNDSETYMKDLGSFASLLQIERVSLLPYHKWGEQKYTRLGRSYAFKETEPPMQSEIERLGEIIRGFGLQVSIGR